MQNGPFFATGSARWETATGVSERIEPSPHKTQISGLGLTPDGTLITAAWDDSVAFTSGVFGDISAVKSESVKLSSQPRGLAVSADGKVSVVAAYKHIFVFHGKDLKFTLDFGFDGVCVAISKDNKLVAVGSADSKVRIYEADSAGKLTEKKVLNHAGIVTSVEFSADGQHLVATDAARKVVPYKIADDFKQASEKDWTFHTARVNNASFSPNGRYIASGGLDTHLMVWDLQKSGEHPRVFRNSHAMSPINIVRWLDDNTLITIGQDSNIKQWKVKNL
uniref:Actin-interacting protein 1 n=1 Tax=Bursaphelenchus xylophilus TaxID=6326 RepID=A0A1I7SGJ0_BURXY